MQAGANAPGAAGKVPGQRKGTTGPNMGNMPMMRGPNGEMLMPNMMQGNAMMMEGNMGPGMGPGGMAGNKRSRAERDAMRAAVQGGAQHPGFTQQQQQNYAMQLAAAGLDEAGRKNLMNMHMAGAYGGMGMNGQGMPQGGPAKKVRFPLLVRCFLA
jgi:hypothetical protein